jgi:hypothetical protein
MSDVWVVVDDAAVARLAGEVTIRQAVLDRADLLVPGSRARAPKDTGAGAASIRAEPILDAGEWTAHVGWDRAHYYMGFQQSKRPFLEE